MRHDPDRVMVGEIRDPDTAQIAVQTALTGHLVFITVHANRMALQTATLRHDLAVVREAIDKSVVDQGLYTADLED